MQQHRSLGPFRVTALGLGCMNLSHGYGVPPAFDDAQRLLLRALDLGCTLFDTAALYGFGANEELVGKVLAPHRRQFTLASKCGLTGVDGKRIVDGRPATLKKTCEESLRRLRTDVIDLYYLHRMDPKVPIEDSIGALSELVSEGKVRTIGVSEVSAASLRKAHAVHPITAIQTEYSLWSRNAEIAVLAACRELGITFVAFSPLARGFLGGTLRDVSGFAADDIRRTMPRFEPANYAANLKLLGGLKAVADEAGATMAQTALAWLLAQGEHVLPIPGTADITHLEENFGADAVTLSAAQLARLDASINQRNVVGARYNAAAQAGVGTEEF